VIELNKGQKKTLEQIAQAQFEFLAL